MSKVTPFLVGGLDLHQESDTQMSVRQGGHVGGAKQRNDDFVGEAIQSSGDFCGEIFFFIYKTSMSAGHVSEHLLYNYWVHISFKFFRLLPGSQVTTS